MYNKDNYDDGPVTTMAMHGGYIPIQSTQGMPGTQTMSRGSLGAGNLPMAGMYTDYPQGPGQAALYAMDPNGGMSGVTQMNHPHLQMSQNFDNCPVVCSVITILCCPMTICCSLAALICSLCSYTDYKVGDTVGFRRKSSTSRCLIIASCIFGLLLCISSALLSYFYHNEITIIVRDFLNYVNKNPINQQNRQN